MLDNLQIFLLASSLLALFVMITLAKKHIFSYWKIRGIPEPSTPPSFPFGHVGCPHYRSQHLGLILKDFYESAKIAHQKHVGLFYMTRPLYLPVDVDIIKEILHGKFQHFSDRGVYYNKSEDPLSAHLFAIKNDPWKPVRQEISKMFSPVKLKRLFHRITESEKYLGELMGENFHPSKGPIDIRRVFSEYTSATIADCVLGVRFEDSEPIRQLYQRLGGTGGGWWRVLRRILVTAYPRQAKKLGVVLNEPNLADFFGKIINNSSSGDFSSLTHPPNCLRMLLQLENKSELTRDEVAAHCFILFLAGFDTTATTISFALYELAKNPEIQEELRREVLQKKGLMTYEDITEMPFLHQVVSETLRMYPPNPVLTRRCNSSCVLEKGSISIEEDTLVHIPVLGVHYDEDIFSEPQKFNPHRFADGGLAKYSFLPFGEGPRKCVGFRLGLMQVKFALICVIRDYVLSLDGRMVEPLKFKVKTTMLSAEGGIWLNATKTENSFLI